MKKIFRKCIASATALALILSTGATAAPAFAETTSNITYDMAQGMAFLDCTNANGMTAASANNGSGMWLFGYTQNGELTYYTELQRRLWDVAAGKVDAWGGAVQVINDRVVLDPFAYGAIGYGFNAHYEWNTLPLGSTATTHLQPTAVWNAQYPGSVTATLKLGQPATTETLADGVLYRVEKVSGSTTTTVYPTGGTTYTSGDGTTGWAKVAQGAAPETVTFTTTVAAEDQLVLRFDSNQNDTEDRMCLYSYVLTETVDSTDITDDIEVDNLAPVSTPEDDTNNLHFSLDELFAVRNQFTRYTEEDVAYLNYRGEREVVNNTPTGLYTGLYPVIENNEDSRFEVGYYGLGSAADTFTHFTRLSQATPDAIAPNDPNLDGYIRSLSYGMRVSESTDYPGYPVDRTMPAAIGTAFGYDDYPLGNSYPGENVRATVRFTAPRSGVVTLRLGMHGPTDLTSDGVLYKITRFYGENRSRVLTSGYQTAAADQTSSWSYLAPKENGATVQEVLPEITVAEGDVIELTFDKNANAEGDFFDLVYYTIQYTDSESAKTVYNMGEGLAVSDTFTGDKSATTTEYKSLTPVYSNNESSASPWRYGYFSTTGMFQPATVLTRPWFTTSRAPEDNTSSYATALSYGYASRLQNYGEIYGWDISNNGLGYVGYDFGVARDGTNSFPGYSNSGRAAVRFVVPKTGTIIPVISLHDSTVHDADPDNTSTHADGVLFKLYKKALDGTITLIYPTEAETTYSASDNTTGWGLIPGSGAEAIWENALVGVNAGDELVLRFDPRKYTHSDEFSIRSYTISYQQQQQYSYDLADAFAVTNTFTGGLEGLYYDYVDGLTPVTANGSGQWKLGYYNWNTEAFTLFTYLNRGNFTTTRAPGDTNNLWPNSSTTLIWSTGSTINTWGADTYVPAAEQATATGNVQANNNPPAAIGYNFSSGNTAVNNSFPGHTNGAQAAIRFSVRHAGTIQPVLSLMNGIANGGVLYRVYKVDGTTGEETDIYPMTGETTYTSADAGTSNWCLLPESMTALLTRDEAKIAVNVGDEIVIRFDKYTTGWPSSKNFTIDTVKMNYVEDYEGNPIDSYDPEMTVVYTEEGQTLDLRRNKMTTQARGTIVYTVDNDIVGALRETATSGVYTLTGLLNDLSDTDREPLTVTASYYAPGDDETAVYSTSTEIYVRSVLRTTEPFSVEPIQTTNLGLTYDTFMLPYYTDAAERARYGAIDLGLSDVWSSATVRFSVADKIEYLGDGYVRAIGAYTFTDAGGGKSPDSSVTQNLPNNTVSSVRDKNTVGTPITMTVVAPDGTEKRYYVLAFKAQIQDLDTNAANVYTALGTSYNQINNAVLYYESYTADGVFTPMVRDTGKTTQIAYVARVIAEDRFTDRSYGGGIVRPGYEWTYPFPLKSYAENYRGIYTGQRGLSQTFEAPKSGTITMTDFLPGPTRTWVSAYMPDLDGGSVSVKLYDADDNLLKTLYTETWGPVKDDNGMFYTDTDGDGTADANEYYPFEFRGDAVYDASVTGDKTNGITFEVVEGQKVRLMVEIPHYTNPAYVTTGSYKTPAPIYTYAETADTITKTDLGDGTYRYTATADIAATTETMHYLTAGYDAAGNFVAVSDGADLAAGSTEVAATLVAPDGVSYLKLFFWEDLTNIRPINGGLLIR